MIDPEQWSMDLDAFRADRESISRNFPIRDVLEHHFGKELNNANRCSCPIHNGDDPNLAVYENENRCYCMSRCRKSWDPVGLVADSLSQEGDMHPLKDSLITLCDEFGISPSELSCFHYRSHTFAPAKKAKKPESAFAWLFPAKHSEKACDWQRHLMLSQRPTQPLFVPGKTDKDGKPLRIKLTDEEIRAGLFQQFQSAQKRIYGLAERTDELLGLPKGQTWKSKTFHEFLKPYDRIFQRVMKDAPEKMELTGDAKTAFDAICMDRKTDPYGERIDDSRLKDGALAKLLRNDTPDFSLTTAPPVMAELKEYRKDEYEGFQKLFTDKTDRELLREMKVMVPHPDDIVESPDGKMVAAPDLVSFAISAKNRVLERTGNFELLRDAYEEAFQDTGVSEKTWEPLMNALTLSVNRCLSMSNVFDDVIEKAEKTNEEEIER